MAQNEAEQVAVLKSMWRRNEAGKWIIHDANAVDLKPREGFSSDYFKIKNELVLLTQRPGPVFESIFSSFGMTEFLMRQSIVPVVAWNEGDEEMRCIGTGFFISATGYLLTAAHVLRDPIDEKYANVTAIEKNQHKLSERLRFGVILPVNPAMRTAPFANIPQEIREAKWFMAPFEWAHHWGNDVESPLIHEKPRFNLTLDIAVCKVPEHPLLSPYQPLNIGLHSLAIGDRAVAIGYGEMKPTFRFGDDDFRPELVVSVGSVTTVVRDNITERQNPTPGPNFVFNAKIPGKMSGGPILVGSGAITKGVVSRSWQNESEATGCLISPVMSLPLHGGPSLHDLQMRGNEGIARMHGRGL
jgi:hypothetical protein